MNFRTKYISGPILYFILLAVLLAIFYELWRLILLILVNADISEIPNSILAKSFLVGWRFDYSISSYLVVPLMIIGSLPFIDIARNRIARRIHTWLIGILTGITFIAHLSDIEYFDFFNVRLNGMALEWNDAPIMALSMIWETYPVIWYFLLHGAMLTAFILAIRWLQRKILDEREISPFWINLLFIPLALLILTYGARGRIANETTLRWGIAYFSDYDFANQLALNPTYTFCYDAFYSARRKNELKQFVKEISVPDANRVVCNLLGRQYENDSSLNSRIYQRVEFNPQNENPPNVVIIIMESFGALRIGTIDNHYDIDLSPCFDSLAEEGILFTNFYSEGKHTYAGIFSTLYGYPHLLGKHITKQVRGQYHVWGLPSIFKSHNYETIFALTHDPHWDNIQGFMKSNGIKRIISSLDFNSDSKLSIWGVPDHIMFDGVYEELKHLSGRRFFTTMMTTSNHGPWRLPDASFEKVPPGIEMEEKFNAYKYSDWAMGQFVRRLQNDPTFENTIIVITADNGCMDIKRIDLDLVHFHIPLLILDNRGQLPRGVRIDRLASQIDILSTVMGLVRIDYDNYSFGRDLFDTTLKMEEFAYLSEWYKIGIVQGDYYYLGRMRGSGPESLYKTSNLKVDLADSLPDLCQEYRKKALSIFEVGYYNLSKPLVHLNSDHHTISVTNENKEQP